MYINHSNVHFEASTCDISVNAANSCIHILGIVNIITVSFELMSQFAKSFDMAFIIHNQVIMYSKAPYLPPLRKIQNEVNSIM